MEVGRIDIEIDVTSEEAQKKINNVTNALQRLKSNGPVNVKVNVNTAEARRQIEKVTNSLQSLRANKNTTVKVDVDTAGAEKQADKLKQLIEKSRDLPFSFIYNDDKDAKSFLADLQVKRINQEIESIRSALGEGLLSGNVEKSTSQDAVAEIHKLEDLRDYMQRMAKINVDTTEAEQKIQSLAEEVSVLKSQLSAGINGEVISTPTIDVATEKTQELQVKLDEVGRTHAKPKVDSSDVDKAHKKTSKFASLLKSIARIAFYRAIRSAIRAITDAFKVGTENAYWYSKTIGNETKYISDAFDSLSSAGYKMKNQLGAAWAQLKVAITPILLEIVRLVTIAADAVAQFFAILGGQSVYLKATDYAKNWAESTSKGAGAAKELKKQLLGFDEINRLEDPTSGGGGGGAALDYSKMFEEAPIAEWMNPVKDAIEWIKTNLDWILDVVLGIGAAFLAWKLARAFGADLKTALGLALAIGGAVVYVQAFIDAWNNGPDWTNLTEMLGGLAAVVIGLGIAFGTTAAAIGLLVGGIGLLVVGIKDWIETGELSTETFATLEAGILAVGAAIALLGGGWIALAIAAVAGIGLAIYKYWDEISAWVTQAWEDTKDWFVTAWDNIKKWFVQAGKDVVKWIVQAWEDVKDWFSQAGTDIADWFSETWENIKKWFSELPEKIGYYLDLIIGKLGGWLGKTIDWVKREVPKIIDNIITFFKELPGKIKEKIDTFVTETLPKWKEDVTKWFDEKIADVGKPVLDFFQSLPGKIKEKITTFVTETLPSWKNDIVSWVNSEFPKIIDSIVNWFAELPGKLFNIGVDLIKGLWNGIASVGDWLKRQFSSFLGGFGSGVEEGYNSVKYSGTQYQTKGRIFASGGFPEDGLFFANHGELVGKFSNGRTAVANNEQITEGIYEATRDANEDLISVVSAGFSQIIRAIEGNESGGIGLDSAARALYPYIKNMQTLEGRSFV